MFGKPCWFRAKRWGWGLVPVTWQGWLYTGAWILVIGLPFVWLVEHRQGVEALIWMSVSLAVLVWDVREILRQRPADAATNVLYIGDEEAPPHETATRKFLFRWK